MYLSIIGALLFYVALYVVSKWFPIMTGHSMQSDWAVILVASVPLLIAISYIIMDVFPVIKTKVAGVEVSLEKAMEVSHDDMVHFDYRLVNDTFQKGRLADLSAHLDQLRNSKKSPNILLVPLSGNMRVTFPALKQYVYSLSNFSSMRFVVFVDMDQRYLGFMPIDKFIAKYPRTSLEVILGDMANDEDAAKYWARIFQLNSNISRNTINDDLASLNYRQWREEDLRNRRRLQDEFDFRTEEERGSNRFIDSEMDVVKLGGINVKIRKDTKPIAAYNLMQENGVNGLPVVDDQEKFLGMVIKDDLLDQLIEQFLIGSEQE